MAVMVGNLTVGVALQPRAIRDVLRPCRGYPLLGSFRGEKSPGD